MEQWIGTCVEWGHLSGLISKTGQANEVTGPHTSPHMEEHMCITVPQPWSSFLALLLKYAWFIKINVETEGLAVARCSPGKCLNQSVGGETAREIRNVPGVGRETTPGNGTTGNNWHILQHGRFWNSICSPAFPPLKEMVKTWSEQMICSDRAGKPHRTSWQAGLYA